ncbi:KasA/KasB family beta-ketoacyl-ACP synthase [Mycobacterium sp. MYCO198283]|uniref:KasA/KasB family beta-ketoacyl-ACP synthase n=1 Tax=Mycobacterium sp. MYCO198283 TaxID=2883505 RepID=UPI001E49A4A7|nr:KasA/KasB family beta-ketoacyl-ACP synthase [Mycobacterium sp. MYCO198283]MCG5433682.1 KasA/KasB family beta-ketoacyl-ACP synthase [Mycobacterium sp. MYCO198283]
MLTTGNGFPDVVVTGVALSSPLATDAEDTWQALLAGRSGIRRLEDEFVERFSLPVRIGGHLLEDFQSELSRVESRRLSFLQQMALIVGRRVWHNAGAPDVDTTRLTVSIASGLGSNEEIIAGYDDMKVRGIRAVSPLHVQMFMPNGPAATVGLERKAKAGVISPTAGDISGAVAIAQGWRQLVLGEADIAICGGVETKIEAVPLASFALIDGMLSRHNDDPAAACKPFDRDRDGMVFGEGCALLVIETEEHAKARGATILARLMGAAITSDAYDALAGDPAGEDAAYALSHSIELAGITPADIDHVNAHAIGTRAGDLAEARAITKALGNAPEAAVYAPKAALGHSIGAAGAIEAILTVLALRDQVVPPTLNLTHQDPEVELDVVAGEARRGNYRYAVSNSFGFGGNNAVLTFGAY